MSRWMMVLGALSLPCSVHSQTIYDGYDDYYPSLAGNIFAQESTKAVDAIKNGVIIWRGHRLHMKKAIVFPGTVASVDDLGPFPKLYEASKLGCIEGQASSSSGTSVRHFAVYLIDARMSRKPRLFKLSTLFNSCLNVRVDNNERILFDSASYEWEIGADWPKGVVFSEYIIEGQVFIPTGHHRVGEFVEDRNVWKFTIKPLR